MATGAAPVRSDSVGRPATTLPPATTAPAISRQIRRTRRMGPPPELRITDGRVSARGHVGTGKLRLSSGEVPRPLRSGRGTGEGHPRLFSARVMLPFLT